MSLTRSVAHNTALQLAGQVSSVVLGLVALAVMTRSLGTEQFGWYVTATGFLQFIGIIIDFGFTVTTSNLLAEGRFHKQSLINTLFSWRLVSALFFLGLAPFIILLFPYPTAVKSAVAVISISFLFLSLNQIFIGYYRSRLKILTVVISELLGRIVLVVGVILVAVGNRGFMPTMIVISVAATVSTLYFLIVYGPIRLQFNRLITKVAFSKMWPTALAVIFNTFYLQGDRVILPIYVSQSEVGLYGSAYRVLDVVIQTAAMVMGLLMPLATAAWARHDLLTFRKRYQLSFDLMMALLLPMVVGAVVLATPLMRFVGGVEFAAAGPILVWLSVAMFAIIIGMTFGHLVLALNRQKQALWVYISTAILSVIAYFIFIPRYGVFGAAGVTVGAEFFAGLMLFAVASYYAKFFPAIKQFLKIVFASSVMGLLVYLIQSIHFLFSVALGAAIYLILIVSLKVVSHSTLKDVLGK